jgi:acetyl-CoA C-acetyltransferase
MREVAILGIGQTKIEEHWDRSLKDLAGEAVLNALKDAGIPGAEAIFVGNMMSGLANNQQHLGAAIADWVGLRFSDAVHIEAACSSGAASFRSALMAVASG